MSTQKNESRVIKKEKCPNCGADIPIYVGYVSWCDQCNWNIQPQKKEQPLNMLQSLYLRLGKKMSHSLFENVVALPVIRPTITLSKLLAFMVAGIVHSISALFVVAGFLVLIKNGLNLFSILFSLLLFIFAWAGLPRFEKVPKNIIPREKCPTLYKLLDTISSALGGKKVGGIVITPDFNAAFTQVGISRKNIVYMGLPLFSVLEDQEKVAVLAHELAHGMNGDPLRGFFIGSAVNTLAEWHYILRPSKIWEPGFGFLGTILKVPFNIILLGISNLFLLTAYGLMYLVFHETQRAEYLADYLATTICGTDAMLSMLSKLYLSTSVEVAIQRVALTNSHENIFSAIQNHVAQMPEREMERLKRVNLIEEARIDVTHPPTTYRIDFLMKHPIKEPQIVLSTEDSSKINSELKSMEESIQKKVVSAYLARL